MWLACVKMCICMLQGATSSMWLACVKMCTCMLQGATSSMWLVCEAVYMHVTRWYKQYVVSV